MPRTSCFDYALHYITRYPKTVKELTIQLRKKGYEDDEIGLALARLEKLGYVNDRQFAELYVGSELVKKGKPVMIVKQKLMLKGVDKHLIDEVMHQYEEDIDQGVIKKIQKEVEKYKSKDLDGFEIVQKLAAKGYSIDQIRKATKREE